MTRLFIAEKPSMAREIAKGLKATKKGDGYLCNGKGDVVTWCYGHILELLSPAEYNASWQTWSADTLPIIPSQWKMKVKDDCKKQFNVIRQLVFQADVIVNAGDPDREGQLLVDEVLEYLHNKKPVQRILLNALDEKSVLAALQNIRSNDEFAGLLESARARSRADWLVGINLSRAYTLMARRGGYRDVIHIGRVQTPTLALVVRREQEIQNFKPRDYYVLKVIWHHNNGDIVSAWQPPDSVGTDTEGRILDKAAADTAFSRIQNSTAKITSIENLPKKEPARLPYSLSSLQVEAGKRYGFSPQKVLDIMQGLYEKKLTTYPRSDCNYLPENQMEDSSEILQNLKECFAGNEALLKAISMADPHYRSRAWNDKKITAHHALIPTVSKCSLANLSDDEQKLYELLARSYCAQFLPEHEYMSTKILLEAENEVFKATGKTVLKPGWKILYNMDKEDEESVSLPKVSVNDTAAFSSGCVESRQTKPPQRYTEATLLQNMKDIHKHVHNPDMKAKLKNLAGIGTEATRASIIDGLIKHGFIKQQKKYLIPSDVGNIIIGILPPVITYPDTTAVWEDMLDRISRKEISVSSFTRTQTEMITALISLANKTNPASLGLSKPVGKCPRCGKNVYESAKAFACEGYAGAAPCKFALWKKIGYGILKGHNITAAQAEQWLKGKQIKFSKLKNKEGKEFSALVGIQDTGEYVNFTLAFEKRAAKSQGWKKFT